MGRTPKTIEQMAEEYKLALEKRKEALLHPPEKKPKRSRLDIMFDEYRKKEDERTRRLANDDLCCPHCPDRSPERLKKKRTRLVSVFQVVCSLCGKTGVSRESYREASKRMYNPAVTGIVIYPPEGCLRVAGDKCLELMCPFHQRNWRGGSFCPVFENDHKVEGEELPEGEEPLRATVGKEHLR
jgi:hypothetical protein